MEWAGGGKRLGEFVYRTYTQAHDIDRFVAQFVSALRPSKPPRYMYLPFATYWYLIRCCVTADAGLCSGQEQGGHHLLQTPPLARLLCVFTPLALRLPQSTDFAGACWNHPGMDDSIKVDPAMAHLPIASISRAW